VSRHSWRPRARPTAQSKVEEIFVFGEAEGATPLAGLLATGAQQAGKAYRIGTLTVSPAERASHFIMAFEERLRELEYLKGSNVIYEHRFADGRTERLSELAKELTALNVDVIIAGNNASPGTGEGGPPRVSQVACSGIKTSLAWHQPGRRH
jgi:hypothetical protein